MSSRAFSTFQNSTNCLSNVVASRSFQNIFSVLYKDGLGRFVEDCCERNCCERIIEGGLLREIYRRLD